ncbi:MAG: type II toxin-antitoxin system HicA family toxin [Candidatus Sungbacteria bacterium]|nr:type II toxin-antitoxin system HicA family toxin [Candidatus Sungbacteria bacterium]
MPLLPSLNARKIIRALKKAGFIEERQKGSHLVLVSSRIKARTVVPIHGGCTIKPSLVYAIIEDARLTVKEFVELL